MGKTLFSMISLRSRYIIIVVAGALLAATLSGGEGLHARAATADEAPAGTAPAAPVGTGFTYQGRLTVSGNPANGQYDFRFTLFDALTGGNQVGSQLSIAGQTVSSGLFTVSLDFGASAFQGDARYLQIEVRQTGGGTYTLLSPRQPLTPAPYALSLRPGAVISGTLSSPLISANNSGSNTGVYGASNSGYGGEFSSSTGTGVVATGGNGIYSTGTASNGIGLWGVANSGTTAKGVLGTSTSGYGVYGSSTANNGAGIYGVANTGSSASGVYGSSTTGYGVYASGGTGVYATGGNGIYSTGTASNGVGLWGVANSGTTAKGVYGTSSSGIGVYGNSTASSGVGVYGISPFYGLYGTSTGSSGSGVYGSGGSSGVFGTSVISNAYGVWGVSSTGSDSRGVYGFSGSGYGVFGGSNGGVGVYGTSAANNGAGILGFASGSSTSAGVYGVGDGYGVYGTSSLWAGYFQGNVNVTGTCCAESEPYARIDDPADPENKYLNQSLVQSADMLSMINGNALLDTKGEAVVTLPDWFVAANGDYRYTLTAIGAPGPGLYIAQELSGSTFKIAGGKAGGKVSWQVTGIRKDPYAVAHPVQPETDKSAQERGKYLHPAEYGQPESKGINNGPSYPTPSGN